MNLKLLKIERFFHLISKKDYNEKRQIEIVKNSPLFDAKWYLNQNPDVKAKKIGAVKHYVKHGWKEGRNPSADFDNNAYLEEYPELEAKGWCPVFHYMLEHKELMPKVSYREEILKRVDKAKLKLADKCAKKGIKLKFLNKYEGKSKDYVLIAKSKYFDKKWYLKQYPDVKKAKVDPIEHYMKYGWKEGRNPSKKFVSNIYLEANPDVKRANVNPLLHYEKYGKKEGRSFVNNNSKLYFSYKYVICLAFCNVISKICKLDTDIYTSITSIDSLYRKAPRILKFPFEKHPLVSIIIPVHNQYKYTISCLHSIIKNTVDISYEIILIDDNSSDKTKTIERKVKNITIIRNKKNLGFLNNCNKAVKKSKGKFVLLLNNDIIVTEKWLKYLLEVYRSQVDVGAVGGHTIFPNGKTQELGRFVLENGDSINKYKNIPFNKIETEPFSCHYCSGCLLLVKKSLWKAIGGFDVRYAPAYYEDNDLCMTIREKFNKKIICQPKCKVFHFHNVSYNSKSNKLSDVNKEKFLKKWCNELKKEEYSRSYSFEDKKLIENSKYFDAGYYGNKYKIKTNGAEHYLKTGYKLNYNPSELFNTSYYLSNNIDVANSKMNPLLHYLRHGQKEGRSPSSEVTSICYNDFIQYIETLKNVKELKILFITHSFSLTGAPMAVLNTAKYFHQKGYNVTVVGFDNADLVEEYKKLGIKVFHNFCYAYANESLSSYLSVFDFYFANTVLAYRWVRIFPKSAYIWRIAEAEDINSKFKDKLLYDTLSKSKNIYAVSLYTKKVLNKFNSKINLLLYGIEKQDFVSAPVSKNIKYLIIGNYCERKGQDIVLKAISELKRDRNFKSEFIFMGSGFEKFKNDKYSKFIGVKKGVEKYKIINSADILLCPSLDDPNPQVVMEGMMMHKPCIVTDKVGQKDYIENDKSGWIIKANSVSSLVNCVKKVNQLQSNEIAQIGRESYKIYDRFFVLDKYLSNVENIVKESLHVK